MVLRIAEARQETVTAAILDSRTLQSTHVSGQRAGYDGAKKSKGNKVHMAVGASGHMLALQVTAAIERDRAQASQLTEQFHEATSETDEITDVDQGYTDQNVAEVAEARGIKLEVDRLQEACKGLFCWHIYGPQA